MNPHNGKINKMKALESFRYPIGRSWISGNTYTWKRYLWCPYFEKPRPCVRRDGTLIMVDDDRLPLAEGETPEMLTVRFRTLGCYPLSGAILSSEDGSRNYPKMMLTRVRA